MYHPHFKIWGPNNVRIQSFASSSNCVYQQLVLNMASHAANIREKMGEEWILKMFNLHTPRGKTRHLKRTFMWTCATKTWNNLDRDKRKKNKTSMTNVSLSIEQNTARAAQKRKRRESWEEGKQDGAALSNWLQRRDEASSNQRWEEETSSTSAGVSAGLAEARL